MVYEKEALVKGDNQAYQGNYFQYKKSSQNYKNHHRKNKNPNHRKSRKFYNSRDFSQNR